LFTFLPKVTVGGAAVYKLSQSMDANRIISGKARHPCRNNIGLAHKEDKGTHAEL
jgi:hypothetical protein